MCLNRSTTCVSDLQEGQYKEVEASDRLPRCQNDRHGHCGRHVAAKDSKDGHGVSGSPASFRLAEPMKEDTVAPRG